MHIEAYERLKLDVTRFDTEDVITTSVIPPFDPQDQGMTTGGQTGGGTGNGPAPGQ